MKSCKINRLQKRRKSIYFLKFKGSIATIAKEFIYNFLIVDISSAFSFLVFVFFVAFFAGTEFPLMQMSKHKLDAFIKQKRFGARSLLILKKQNERLLIVDLIGTVIFTSLAAKLAGDIGGFMQAHFHMENNIFTPFIAWILFSL